MAARLAGVFRYSVAYRPYTLAKAGCCLAYFWYVADFFRIHAALRGQPVPLLPPPSQISFSGWDSLDVPWRALAVFLSGAPMVWTFALAAPVAAGLFLWGRRRWLQFAVGAWLSLSMVALASLVGVFVSSADVWLNHVFVGYSLAALTTRSGDWETREPGLRLSAWRANPTFRSTFAWTVVVLQFAVYFYAGVNKLVFGWTPWVTGTAIQNLAFDDSVHAFARNVPVPYVVSLVLCYVTLLQRLVVPFGFFVRRFRWGSVLILGTMHVGYAVLMKVAIFPLVGLSCLLMVLPPAPPPVAKKVRPRPQPLQKTPAPAFAFPPTALLALYTLWLLLEPARLTVARALPWENKLMVVPAWRMFADGGATAGKSWRLILETSAGDIDATDLARQRLPGLWRDRFYEDLILHDLLRRDIGPGTLPQALLQATERAYNDQPATGTLRPTVRRTGFELRSTRPKTPESR